MADMPKNEALVWAMTVIGNHVKSDSYGNIIVSMANGHISGIKAEINHKPCIDHKPKKT